jgi:phosphoribosyl-AMP cyclohydrolase
MGSNSAYRRTISTIRYHCVDVLSQGVNAWDPWRVSRHTPAVTCPRASLRHNCLMPLDQKIADRLKRGPDGLVPAVVQQHDTGEVLMLAWMDDEALHRTLTTGRATYWSRSRRSYWVKGETSGHVQRVRHVALDCDGDTILLKVDQAGAACHTGDRTCFDADVLEVSG